MAEKGSRAKGGQGDHDSEVLPASRICDRLPNRDHCDIVGVFLFLLRHANDAFRGTGKEVLVATQGLGRGQRA